MKNKASDEEDLSWINERFLKSLAKVHYLCVIERGGSTGYDILQYMRSHYRLKLSAAAVYPVLQSLEEGGYIMGVWLDDGYPKRKQYNLTACGRKLLQAARKRINALARELTSGKAGVNAHGRA